MIAGLPGTGISGLFYLLCAVLMPVCELYYTVRGRSSLKRWGIVMQQFLIACAIIVGFWLIDKAFWYFLNKNMPASQQLSNVNILKFHPIVLPLTALLFVLFAVFVTQIILKFKK